MSERTRPLSERGPGSGGPGGIFDNSQQADQPVTVSSGPYMEQLPVGNRTVGEVRRRFGDRLGLDPQSQAVLDGNDVDDDTVVRPGQALMFVRRAGEKGQADPAFDMEFHEMMEQVAAAQTARRRRRKDDGSVVNFEGEVATAKSPEGVTASMPMAQLLTQLAPGGMDTADVILPEGVRCALTQGATTVWVHETPPSVHRLVWIAKDSPVPFGEGAKYREVRLALPYLIMVVVFDRGPGGHLYLSDRNECFFRTAPLKSLDDELCYPALLNCSKFEPQKDKPLSWICTQHLSRSRRMLKTDLNERLRDSLSALKHCLLETGFNYSSEHHEVCSWFTASREVDKRVNTVEAWEKASSKDPLFVLEVPWLPTKHSVRQAVDRIFQPRPNMGPRRHEWTAASLARLIFNHQSTPHAVKLQAPPF